MKTLTKHISPVHLLGLLCLMLLTACAGTIQPDATSRQHLTQIIDAAAESLPETPEASLQTLKQINQPASQVWVAYAYMTGTGAAQDETQGRLWLLRALQGLAERYPSEPLGGSRPSIDEALQRCDGITRDTLDNTIIHFGEQACANITSRDIRDILWQIKFITASYDGQLTIPCWLLEKHYESISVFAPYWVGNRDNFPATCRTTWLEEISQHRAFIETLSALGNEDECSGSIIHSILSARKMRRIEAAYHPEMLKPPSPLTESYLTWAASESIGNYKQYQALKVDAAALTSFLSQHAQNYSEKWKANPTAYTARLLDAYYSTYLTEFKSPLTIDYASSPDWQAFTQSHDLAAAKRAKNNKQLYNQMLNHAILFDFPLDNIKTLTKHINGKAIAPKTLFAAVTRPPVLAHLLSLHADVEATNELGETPLFEAISHNQPNSIAMLLAAGADINAQTFDPPPCFIHFLVGSRTPLMYAAWLSTPETVKYLLNHGADASAKDSRNEPAAAYLERNNSLSAEQRAVMVKLLSEKGNGGEGGIRTPD